jgi:hypothetical protein
MIKVLKMMVLGISALLVTLPAYAQEAAKEQSKVLESAGKAQSKGLDAAKEPSKGLEATGKEPGKGLAAAKEQVNGVEADKGQSKRLAAAKEQVKGLDEQVQEIKTDVLGIAAQLNQLEEKLLYPSDTQVAVFVSVAEGEKFRLDAVDIGLDGKSVAHHLYVFKELEALQKGGVQRIYVGNVRTGEHALQVSVMGKSEGGSDLKKQESFKITKGIGPKFVGIVLAGSKTITVKDW